MGVAPQSAAGGASLTTDAARRAVLLWLAARRRAVPVSMPAGDAEDLRWLGLDWDAEAPGGETPAWLTSLAPLEESPPSPWGQWSGRTPVAELRELGVLPEAMVNFLALCGWTPAPDPATGQPREVFGREELLAEWSPEALSRQPVVFDLELLRRLNHAWLQRADLDRLLALALPYYQRVGWMPAEPAEPVRLWLRDVIRSVLPGLDFLSLLPPRTRLVFDYRPENSLLVPESRQTLEREGAREVIRLFGQRALEESWLTAERFQEITAALKRSTSWRGRGLFQPIQVMLTGLPFGPELTELIPLIERGAELDLPVRVKSCRERIVDFCSVFV